MSQRLATVGTLVTDVRPEKRPFVALEHLVGGEGRIVDGWDGTPVEPSVAGVASAEPGDVLFGKLRPYLRKGLLVSMPLHASTELLAIRPEAGIEPRWLAYLTAARPFIDWSVSTSEGSKMPRTSWAKLREYRTDVPDPTQQRRIADFLDAETARIDALIAAKQQTLQVSQERWLTEVVESCSDPTWPARPLRYWFAAVFGGTWGSDPGDGEEDVKCIRGADFDFVNLVAKSTAPMRGVSMLDLRRRCLSRDDLVIEKSGGGAEQFVGRVVKFTGEGPAVPTNFAAGLRCRPDVDAGFAVLALRALYEMGATKRWTNQTTGIQNLDLGGYLSERVGCPPVETQRAVANHLQAEHLEIQSLVHALKAQISLLGERRQALVTAAVSGELEV